MKITLYIRKTPKKPGWGQMFTRAEDEPCYDTPRILNLGAEIREHLDGIIAKCEADGVFAYGDDGYRQTLGASKEPTPQP